MSRRCEKITTGEAASSGVVSSIPVILLALGRGLNAVQQSGPIWRGQAVMHCRQPSGTQVETTPHTSVHQLPQIPAQSIQADRQLGTSPRLRTGVFPPILRRLGEV